MASAFGQWIWSNRWSIVLLVHVALGFVVSTLARLRNEQYSTREISYIRLMGELWLNAVRAVSLPLLVTSTACSLYQMNRRAATRYLIILFVWAVVAKLEVGLLASGVTALLSPGTNTGSGASTVVPWMPAPETRIAMSDVVMDMVRDTLPDNPVGACVRHPKTTPVKEPNDTEPGTGDPLDYKTDNIYVYQSDLLGVITGSLAVGVAMGFLADKVAVLVEVSLAVRDTCRVLTNWLLVPAGPCIMMLVVADVVGAYHIPEQLEAMQTFIITLVLTLALQMFVVYPLVYIVVVGRWQFMLPLQLLWQLCESYTCAFVSSSTHVAYPFAVRCLNKLHENESELVTLLLSVSSVVNMDGTMALLTASGLWGKQRQGDIVAGHYIGAVALAFVGSMAAFGENRMNAYMIVMVMTSLDAKTRTSDIAPLMVLNWFTDPLATVVNIAGATFAASALARRREYEQEGKGAEGEEAEKA